MKKKILVTILSILFIFSLVPIVSAYPRGKAWGREKITIVRDNFGVPHVFAKTKEALAFGAGYAMAQDRLWQADIFRRAAFGSLAEFGLATIEQDYQTRKLGYSKEELQEIFDNWVPTQPNAKLKEMNLAYIDGVNYYISEAITALLGGDPSLMPIEYLANGILPEPFTIADSVAITVMMAWRFGGTGGNELNYYAALQALQSLNGDMQGWLMFNDLYPQQDPGAEVTIPGSGCKFPSYGSSSSMMFLPEGFEIAFIEYEKIRMGQSQLFESLGVPTKFGSNAWVVSPKRTTTGNAMELGGPQMGHTIPQIVFEVGLHGAGIDAVGMMMPQAPSILIGVNKYGAWTSTTGGSDVMDTYIEQLNPLDHTQYLYNGEWVNMEVRTETFYSAFEPTDTREIYRTVHGPILFTDEVNHLAFTIKAPYYKNELAAEEGWSLFQQAKHIWDFQKAVKTIQPSHNFLWADRNGRVGYWHAGTFPIKPETGVGGRIIDDRFPLYGTGEEEWVGLTGFEEMPKCIDPKDGFLANWNNKPIANWPYAEADWGEGHRVKRIQELLTADDAISFEDMNRINMDAGYNHIPAMNFLDYLIDAASTSSDPKVQTALPYLESWNEHYNDIVPPRWPDPSATYDDPGLTIFERWYSKIFNEVFDEPGVNGGSSTLIHVFDGVDSKLPLSFDYLNGEDRDEVINRVLNEVMVELIAERGSDISTWLTPVRTVTFSAQGALPAPTMHAMNRGTYNQIAEMVRGKWWNRWWKPAPHAVNVIPPGQSGFVQLPGIPSDHAYDQLMLYETWTYKPMRYYFWDIWKVRESVTYLYF
ncbi:MAG: penicillin acylase family protein [Candidatus Thorarchaeota archaeon]